MNYALLLIVLIGVVVFFVMILKPELLNFSNTYTNAVKEQTDGFLKSIPKSQEFTQYSLPFVQVVKN